MKPLAPQLRTIERQEALAALEDLFADAMQQKNKTDKHHLRNATPAKACPEPLSGYLNPDNWTKSHGVALIHRESGTLIGRFSAWYYKREKECRKLVRESELLAVTEIRYLSGDFWLEGPVLADIKPPERWTDEKRITKDVVLQELQLVHPACPLLIKLAFGHLHRIELTESTLFAGEGQLLELPAGTNLIEALSLEAKLEIKKELGI